MAFPNLPTTGSRYKEDEIVTIDTLKEPTTTAEKNKQEKQKQKYQDYLDDHDSRKLGDTIAWINDFNNRLNGNGKISTPVTSLRKKTVIPPTITIDDFISMWNSKIDEMLFKWEVPLKLESHNVIYVPEHGLKKKLKP